MPHSSQIRLQATFAALPSCLLALPPTCSGYHSEPSGALSNCHPPCSIPAYQHYFSSQLYCLAGVSQLQNLRERELSKTSSSQNQHCAFAPTSPAPPPHTHTTVVLEALTKTPSSPKPQVRLAFLSAPLPARFSPLIPRICSLLPGPHFELTRYVSSEPQIQMC